MAQNYHTYSMHNASSLDGSCFLKSKPSLITLFHYISPILNHFTDLQILQPALSENLINLQEAEGIENILKSSSGTPFHDHLVTLIGVVGGLLGWPVWLNTFKTRRLSNSHQQPAIVSC